MKKQTLPPPSKKPMVGTGAGLERYERFIIRIVMAERPSTRPGGTGNEGYPTMVNVISKVNSFKAPEEYAQQLQDVTSWNIVGQPNEHVWIFPEGAVKPGMMLACNGVWVNATPRGASPNYRYELHIDVPEQEETETTNQ